MRAGISFVISTGGQREHIRETIASCMAQGTRLEDYEIVIAGETRHVPKDLPDCVRILHIPLDGLPVGVYCWQDAIRVATMEWIAPIADDMTLAEDWADRLTALEDPPPLVFGRLRDASGKQHKRKTMTTRSIIGVFQRELFGRFPLDRGWGEDARWCKHIHAARVPFAWRPDLLWVHHGTKRGLGSTSKPMFMFGQAHLAEPLPLPLKRLKLIPSIRGIIGVFEDGKHVGAFKADRLADLLAPGPDGLEERILAVSKRKMKMPLAIYIDTSEPDRLAAALVVIVAEGDTADWLTYIADRLTNQGLPTIVLGQRGGQDRLEERIVSWMAYPDRHLDASKMWVWDRGIARGLPWLRDFSQALILDLPSIAAMPVEEATALLTVLLMGNQPTTIKLNTNPPMTPPVSDGVADLDLEPAQSAGPAHD